MNPSPLHQKGYIVHTRAIPIEASHREAVEECVTLRRERKKPRKDAIFNNKRNSTGDNKRLLMPVRTDLSGLRSSILAWVHLNYPHHTPTEMTIITSLPGCKRQVAHCDCEPTPEQAMTQDAHFPCSCLVALEEGTRLYVWPGTIRFSTNPDLADKITKRMPMEIIDLGPGDIVIFRGDLIHAGADYSKTNHRIHLHLDCPVLKKPSRQIWYPPEHWTL